MRYYTRSDTLFIRGPFRAASTGVNGGIRSVSTLLNHTLRPDSDSSDAEKELEMVATGTGIGRDYFGLLTTVPADRACVLQYDFITVFITAGIRREAPGRAGSVCIIITSSEGMSDGALLETIMVATEAKAEALLALDLPLTGDTGRYGHGRMRGGGAARFCRAPVGSRKAGERGSTPRDPGSPHAPRFRGERRPPGLLHLQPDQGGTLDRVDAGELPVLPLPFRGTVLRVLLLPVLSL